MSIIKYAAGIPAAGAVIASLYGALQYVNNLQNTTESNKNQFHRYNYKSVEIHTNQYKSV